MSNFPDQQGNYQQQHFNFSNGNTQGQYTSQQYSWTSSQQHIPIQPPTQAIAGTQPQLQFSSIPQTVASLDLGQLQQNHNALHLAGIQSGLQAQQNMLSAMQSSMNIMAQPQQPTLVQQPPRPQIQYMQSQPPLQYSLSPVPPPPPPPPPPLQPPQIAGAPYAGGNNTDDERRQELIREAKKLEARLASLEQSQAHGRAQQEVKDREIAAAQAREQHLHQRLLEAEQRHSRALADMAASQAQPSPPAFDMSVLQKVIGKVQSDRISRTDIKQLVEDAVSAQLAGVAKTSDINSAASRMEKGLQSIPIGASTVDVEHAVQQELAKAVQKVARHTPAQQLLLESSYQQADHTSQQQPLQLEAQNIEELTKPQWDGASQIPSSHKTRKALLAPPEGLIVPFSGTAPPHLVTDAPLGANSYQDARTRSGLVEAPAAENVMAGIGRNDGTLSRSSRKSTVSAQPSYNNTVVRSEADPTRGHRSSAQAMVAAQARGRQLSERGGHRAFVEATDDFPDNASQVTAWERSQASRQPMRNHGTVVRVRPRNDRRVDVGQTPPMQIGAIPEEHEDVMAIVKQSKDVARSRR